MKRKIYIALYLMASSCIGSRCFSQDTLRRALPPGYDPNYGKIIPDKVFEIGIPLLVLFLLSNAVVHIFKIKAENRLKEKAMDKQLTEPTLIALFSEEKVLAKYQYLKYFLILAALGLSFLSIQFLADRYEATSGYLALGILSLFLSVAFVIYYSIIRNK